MRGAAEEKALRQRKPTKQGARGGPEQQPSEELKQTPAAAAAAGGAHPQRPRGDAAAFASPAAALNPQAARSEAETRFQDINGSRWTEDHLKLLFLISQYSHCASSADEQETWIRKTPLLVLIYHGIVKGVFDYDYAPACEYLGHRSVWLNVSQEGADDIDDLREGGLVNGLKLSSSSYASSTAFQISADGEAVLRAFRDREPRASAEMFDAVLATYRHPVTSELMMVRWDPASEHFLLVSGDAPPVASGVTDCEDVSYVCSPWLPASLLPNATRSQSLSDIFPSNRHRLAEAAAGSHTIQDELDELIHLRNVKLLFGEWIPFGENQILSLNDKLGSAERVQGGLFTRMADDNPHECTFQCSPGLTGVRVVDFDLHNFVAVHADIHFPEAENVVQIEHFGMCVASSGDVAFGLALEGVLDRSGDRVSLDHLARVLMDIRLDSSQIIDSLLSTYQRNLLDVTFSGKSRSRPKFNVILAEQVEPRLAAAQYMDKEGLENELKQVLGETQSAHDLGDGELLVMGRHGILLVGREACAREAVIVSYCALMGASLFTHSFFRRMFTLRATLQRVRDLVGAYASDPNSLPRIRLLHSQTEQEVIALREILSYLEEAVHNLQVCARPQAEGDPLGSRMWDLLGLGTAQAGLARRVMDMKKNMESARSELQSLQAAITVLAENRMFALQESVQANTHNLEDVFRSNERSSASLDVMQMILAGTLAFEILDRLTGEWSVVDLPWAQFYIAPLMQQPGMWFFINICLWLLIGLMLLRLKTQFTIRSNNVLILRVRCNARVDLAAMRAFLARRQVQEENVEADETAAAALRKVHWAEEADPRTWPGPPPEMEMQFDQVNGFLLSATLTVAKVPGAAAADDAYRAAFFRLLRTHRVLADNAAHNGLAATAASAAAPSAPGASPARSTRDRDSALFLDKGKL